MGPDEQTEGAEDGERREPLSSAPARSPPSNEPPRDEARPFRQRLWGCFRTGVPRGARTALWLLAIMVPVSFGVLLLAWTGVLDFLARLVSPVFGLVGLPGEAAVAFITGALVNAYSCIATLGAIDLTDREVTILAVMVLTCHNLFVEVAVLKKAGSSAWRMVLLRLGTSLAAGAVLNLVLPAETGHATAREIGDALTFAGWARGTAILTGKVIGIVMGLTVVQRMLDEFGVTRVLARVFFPLLWLMGLPRKAAFLWIVVQTLGLAYGAAVIIERAEEGELTRDETEMVNRHAAVCHSLLEDTLVWLAIGAWVLWITLPRVALAALVVWGYRLWRAVLPGPEVRASDQDG